MYECSLSRRWRYTLVYRTNLDFNDEKRCSVYESISEGRLRMSRFADWVSSVVSRHRWAKIDRFRVAFKLEHKDVVDEWIRFAMRKGVRSLELDLPPFCSPSVRSYQFNKLVLGIRECSTFKALCSEYSGFKFLKALDLNNVDVDQEVVEYFIYNCTVLERVAVRLSDLLLNLRVVGQSVVLKHLTIEQCDHLKSIVISEANLVSFTYGGFLDSLVLRNVPLLVELTLSYPGDIVMDWFEQIDFSYLSCCVSQLEILRIRYRTSLYGKNPVVPLLPNLKCLELELDEADPDALFLLSSYIRQAPRLHTLNVKFPSKSVHNRKGRPFAKKRASRCCNDSLKVVTFIRYYGLSRQIETVKYLVKTASNFAKIIFDPVDPDRSEVIELQFPRMVENKELSRAEARKLEEELSSTLDVVFL